MSKRLIRVLPCHAGTGVLGGGEAVVVLELGRPLGDFELTWQLVVRLLRPRVMVIDCGAHNGCGEECELAGGVVSVVFGERND